MQKRRWKTRKLASNEINLVSMTQNRATLQDRKNKGGKSLVLRCASAVKKDCGCPFYCKLRRSNKDGMWYVCTGLELSHCCAPSSIPPKYSNVNAMIAMRNEADREEGLPGNIPLIPSSKSLKRKLGR